MNLLPPLRKDGYKADHRSQYPDGTTCIYNNMTLRSSRLDGVRAGMVFGIQYWVIEYLIRKWHFDFFARDLDTVLARYKRRIDNYLGPGAITYDHIADLHKLQYLPLHIKALPEGTLVPLRVPFMTVRNTIPEFFWLTNGLETNQSNVIWGGINSATIAYQYRKNFERFSRRTGFPKDMIKWMGHDFSYRGMFGEEAALVSGAAHLLSFTGTDTIPAIDFLEEYYGANCETELIGGSVPATEHSVMSMGSKESELETFRRLITKVYPKGIVSIVSDTWDYWKVVTEILPALKQEILARDGKVVIRPDSGDPVKIICGDPDAPQGSPQFWGTMMMLKDIFGATQNNKGYWEINPKIGAIYGDSITIQRQQEILQRLEAMGFASSPVLGIGSFTYQYNTRDTLGQAIKATYGEVNGEGREIFKKPATDDGTKNSARGLLNVTEDELGKLTCLEGVDWNLEGMGRLQTVFLDGNMKRFEYLSDMRKRVDAQVEQELSLE